MKALLYFVFVVDPMQGIVGCHDNFELLYHDLELGYNGGDGELSPSLIQRPFVQGSLREHSSFWLEELEPSSFVKEVIMQGYRIPFIRLRDPVCYKNHKSAIEHSKFVQDAIQELVSKHCVVQSFQCPAVCSPLSVVVNARGKERLVIDLCYINQFILMTSLGTKG